MAPTPAWPDTSYPKSATETIVSAFCAPGAPGLLGLGINSDAGLPGPTAFVLPVTAEWMLDASPTTTTTTTITTTTTVVTPSTTTTTLGCTSAAECSDADPCTDDVCTGGTCSNPHVAGASGVSCEIDQIIDRQACGATDTTDVALQAAWTKFLGKATGAVQAIDGASTTKKAAKLKIKAGNALKALLKKMTKLAKKPGRVSTGCQASIRQDIGAIQALLSAL